MPHPLARPPSCLRIHIRPSARPCSSPEPTYNHAEPVFRSFLDTPTRYCLPTELPYGRMHTNSSHAPDKAEKSNALIDTASTPSQPLLSSDAFMNVSQMHQTSPSLATHPSSAHQYRRNLDRLVGVTTVSHQSMCLTSTSPIFHSSHSELERPPPPPLTRAQLRPLNRRDHHPSIPVPSRAHLLTTLTRNSCVNRHPAPI